MKGKNLSLSAMLSYATTIFCLVLAAEASEKLEPSVFAGGGNGEWPAEARFTEPLGLTFDTAGNLYILDATVLLKITPGGTTVTLAGQYGQPGTNDGPGIEARFGGVISHQLASRHHGMAVDQDGNIFLADTQNRTIRKIAPDGYVSTFAGQPRLAGSTDGPAHQALFNQPKGVTFDHEGNLYVADDSNTSEGRIRKISPDGTVLTLSLRTSTGDPYVFLTPTTIVHDGEGGFYVGTKWGLDRIFRIGADRTVTPVLGVSTEPLILEDSVYCLASYGSNLFWSTDKNQLLQMDESRVVRTLAGLRSTPGTLEGTGSEARIQLVEALTADAAGIIYAGDALSDCIWQVTPQGQLSLLTWTAGGSADGDLASAKFLEPQDLVVAPDGTIYVADTLNHTIRKITRDGQVTTLAGEPGMPGDVDGLSFEARLNSPRALAISPADEILVFHPGIPNGKIRRVTTDGNVSSWGALPMQEAGFMATDGDGNIYVTAPLGRSAFWKIPPAGPPQQMGRFGSHLDGPLEQAAFSTPAGLVCDRNNNIYVADPGASVIRKINADGIVSTIAGQPGQSGWDDGSASTAKLYKPVELALAPDGGIYVLDNGSTVRKVALDGAISTLSERDAIGKPYWLETPTRLVFAGGLKRGLAVGPQGEIYIAHAEQHAILVFTPAPELRLSAEMSTGSVILAWPEQSEGWILQSSARLGPNAQWATSQEPVVTQPGRKTVQAPLAQEARFFRMIRE